MKYLETCFYNEFIVIEHEGKEHTRSLRGVQENNLGISGIFEFEGKKYLLKKYMTYDDPILKTEITEI